LPNHCTSTVYIVRDKENFGELDDVGNVVLHELQFFQGRRLAITSLSPKDRHIKSESVVWSTGDANEDVQEFSWEAIDVIAACGE